MAAIEKKMIEPRQSRLAGAVVLAIFIGLAVTPFAFSGSQSLNVAAKICYFIVLAASFDLLLGYSGIISFAHTMFFGIGGYGAAIALHTLGASWNAVLIGTISAIALALVLAFLIGLFSLRLRTIFFAMITLAVATFFAILASQLSTITGGEEGRTFTIPEMLRPGYKLLDQPIAGVTINGRILAYYLIFITSILLFVAMLRLVRSPFGRVLQAMRENSFRTEALGFNTISFRIIVNCIAAVLAALAGVLCAIWLRYTGPGTTLSFDIMMDILLIVVIGGMGTLYGAVVGATLLLLAESYLQNLMGVISQATVGLPILPQLFHPDRLLLWLGILFILSIYFFPTGIVGKLQKR